MSNRTTFTNESSQTDNYAYDSYSNRLDSITKPADTLTYLLDDNGNTISRTSIAGEGFFFTYTPDNRLAQVDEKILAQGQLNTYLVANYEYNANGQRVSKTVSGVTTHYVYHLDGSLLYETNTAGSYSMHYLSLHTGGLPQGLAVVVNDSAQSQSEEILYQHNDHLTTPKVLTDSTGNIVWQASYTPFGLAAVNADVDGDGTSFILNTRFPGQHYDAETGLHYNYFRYYDPSTGRYITPDPIGLAGGINTFGYVGGNPLIRYDALGLFFSEAFKKFIKCLGNSEPQACGKNFTKDAVKDTIEKTSERANEIPGEVGEFARDGITGAMQCGIDTYHCTWKTVIGNSQAEVAENGFQWFLEEKYERLFKEISPKKAMKYVPIYQVIDLGLNVKKIYVCVRYES